MRRRPALLAGLVAATAALVVVALLSITLGARDVSPASVWQAVVAYDPTDPALATIREMRLPRTLLGLLAGIALGISGTILQAATRNPLADPGIMGINAGAAAGVVTAVMLLGVQSLWANVWFAFAGAAVATVTVYTVASFGRAGATPVKLALAGAAVAAGMLAVTSGIVVTNANALNELRFWQVGALSGRYLPVVVQVAPFILVAAVVALGCGRLLNGLALGDDTARALGLRVRGSRVLLFALVAVLCGAATAACGPIVFLGLVVPHIARVVCGPDHRWLLPYVVVLAPTILLACDIVGRVAGGSGEIQVGVVLGVLCAPFFVLLVRFGRLSETR